VKISFRFIPFIFYLFINIASGTVNSNLASSIALGLSDSYAINPFDSNRFLFQSSISLESFNKNRGNWYYPDIGFGYKISKNLAITGSVFSYDSGNFSYQKTAAGFQYFFGSNDTLNWVSSLKRVNLKSIKNYYINNITFNICKWIQYKTILFRLGSGFTFYKKTNLSIQSNLFRTQKGQVNFIFISSVFPINYFKLGLEAKINPNKFYFSLFLKKDFFK
tara:strand:+ start:384 stop:1043 length:660 start_codon:yes stop_codon:yes gene_type:complete